MCVLQEIILNIDVAPTIVDLAGIKDQWLSVIDGESFKPLLIGNSTASKWRSQFLVEHDGEHQSIVKGCPAKNNQDVGVSLAC